MATIKIVRLTSGEELICNVITDARTEDGQNAIRVEDVAILIPTQSNSLGLAPFMAYSNASTDGLIIKHDHIMFTADPVDGLQKQYENMFSKIITPSPQKIIV